MLNLKFNSGLMLISTPPISNQYKRWNKFNLMLSALLGFFSICFIGCSNTPKYPVAENSLNAGISFLQACLQGDFERANFYMLKDQENETLLQKNKNNWRGYSREERRQLKEASLQNIRMETITENEDILYFINSYNQKTGKLKIIKLNNEWLVDFKYTFNPNL